MMFTPHGWLDCAVARAGPRSYFMRPITTVRHAHRLRVPASFSFPLPLPLPRSYPPPPLGAASRGGSGSRLQPPVVVQIEIDLLLRRGSDVALVQRVGPSTSTRGVHRDGMGAGDQEQDEQGIRNDVLRNRWHAPERDGGCVSSRENTQLEPSMAISMGGMIIFMHSVRRDVYGVWVVV
jgi:hypothetical protein